MRSFCAQKFSVAHLRFTLKREPPYILNGAGNKNTLPTLHFKWWATKIRYPPYIFKWWATKTRYPPYILNGGQQKHVTHPTLIDMVGNKNTLPTLHFKWWATKTRYPPYILITDN